MNLVFSILLVITALIIIWQDNKYQSISFLVVILNYILICFAIHPILLLGLIAFIQCIKHDIPIDFIYITVLCVAFLYMPNNYNLICILPLILQALLVKKKTLSFMVAIESAYIMFFIIHQTIFRGLLC